jgi:ribosomal protein S18 acetylase RimI-like enzyme
MPPPLTSRLYAGERDLPAMLDLLVEGRAQTDDWRYPHVGDLLFWFFMVVRHLDPYQHIRLWQDGERLVGYAMLGEDPAFDCQALPEYAWRGIEEAALDWAEALVAGLRVSHAQHWSGPLVSGARQDDARRIAFLERRGFRPGGQFSEVNLICSLEEPIPDIPIPAGCKVCSMAEIAGRTGSAEISSRAAAHREVWQPWTVGNVSDEDYACFMRLPGYRPDLDVVALAPDGAIAAYVNGWIDPRNRIGDFGPVGARPAYRRQGLTRLVLVECLRRMRSYGMNRVSVSTGVANTPAIRLYESVGFRIVNRYLEYLKSG